MRRMQRSAVPQGSAREHGNRVSDPLGNFYGYRRLRDAEKLAVILGTEGEGLCDRTIALSDHTVKIPMSHGVDSLNVAAASAVAFWEMGRKPRNME